MIKANTTIKRNDEYSLGVGSLKKCQHIIYSKIFDL